MTGTTLIGPYKGRSQGPSMKFMSNLNYAFAFTRANIQTAPLFKMQLACVVSMLTQRYKSITAVTIMEEGSIVNVGL